MELSGSQTAIVSPTVPSAGLHNRLVQVVTIFIVAGLDVKILIDDACGSSKHQVIENRVLQEILLCQVPSQSDRGRECSTIAFGQLGGIRHRSTEVHVIFVPIVVGCLETQVGIGGAVIAAALLGLPSIGKHHSEHIVVFVEGVLIVELTGHIVCVTVGRVIDVFAAALLVLAILRDARNNFFSIISTPYGCKSGITAAVALIVGRSIVNTIFDTEIESLEQRREIDIKTRVELELAAHEFIVAGSISIRHRIGGILLRTAEEVLATLKIITVEHSIQRVPVRLFNETQRNQR